MLRLSQRVQSLEPQRTEGAWQVDGQAFDRVILACSAAEAARLTASLERPVWRRAWSAQAAALRYQPIITVYLQNTGPAWPCAHAGLAGGAAGARPSLPSTWGSYAPRPPAARPG